MSRERVGWPQIFAGVLLLAFIGQCVWLVAHIPPGAVSSEDFVRVQEGLSQWQGNGIAGTRTGGSAEHAIPTMRNEYDPQHSPLWYLIESAPLALFRVALISAPGVWLSRIPYIFIGTLLGASLWYVSRRLYGNSGGYIALALYCFSPAVIRSSVLWFAGPDIAAAWGTFGAVFTAIAVSHTLYAPREVILWNWRRILLLGVSLAMMVGSQFNLVVIIPVTLLFMLYVAAERWAAVLAICASACAIGFALLLACYFFQARILAAGLAHASWLDFHAAAFGLSGAWMLVLREIRASGPVLVVLVPAALLTFVGWRRARYFGNTAPLIVAIIFVVLRIASPHEANSGFALFAVIFLFVFVAGILADILETRFSELSAAVIVGLLAANAVWNVMNLVRIAR